MKTHITTLLVMIATAICAQPQLQSTLLQTGNTFDLYNIANPNMANILQGGANVNWDVSTTTSTKVAEVSIVNASSTPHASTYPDANVALQFVVGSATTYNMFKLSSTAFEELASGLGGSSPTIYNVTRHVVKLPLSYSDNYTDDYQKQGQVVKTLTAIYDAYGTLKTADSLYSNVARVLQVNGDGDLSAIWWHVTTTEMYPLMQADNDGFIFWKKKVTTGISETTIANQLAVYPNPAVGNICFNTNQTGAIAIYSIDGKMALQSNCNLGENTLQVDGLKSGIYYFVFTSNTGEFKTGKISIN